MRKRTNIERATATDLQARLAHEGDRTDWARVDAMPQALVERLADDEDDGPLPAGWADTITLGIAERKQGVHIRLDPEVLRWFKAQGPGYQTRINAVLLAFVRAKSKGEPQPS